MLYAQATVARMRSLEWVGERLNLPLPPSALIDIKRLLFNHIKHMPGQIGAGISCVCFLRCPPSGKPSNSRQGSKAHVEWEIIHPSVHDR